MQDLELVCDGGNFRRTRPDGHSTLLPSAVKTTEDDIVHEGGPFEGYG